MKRVLITIVMLMSFVVSAFAGMLADGGGRVVPTIAPDGNQSQTLTLYSTIIDMTKNVRWILFSPTACKARILPTNAKGTKPAFTIPQNTFVERGVHRDSVFVNFSGCTLGELQRQ